MRNRVLLQGLAVFGIVATLAVVAIPEASPTIAGTFAFTVRPADRRGVAGTPATFELVIEPAPDRGGGSQSTSAEVARRRLRLDLEPAGG